MPSELASHPMQPIALDAHGIPRFKANAIVKWLFDSGLLDLNRTAAMQFSDEDRMQIAQLLGYSVGGYSELSYVTDESYEAAEAIAKSLLPCPEPDTDEWRPAR